MPNYTRVPTELWREIITGACTDGGSTGRSLALTNKFFHAQSLPTRFHSLSFTSLARVEAFLAFIDGQPKECNPKVQHLCLSFLEETEPAKPPSDFWKTYSSWTKEKKQQHDETVEDQKEKWNMRFTAAMTKLFGLVGPHLRSLCVFECMHLRFPEVPIAPLPSLQELSLLGGYDLFMFEKSSRKQPSLDHPALRFPSLQRLHCICVQWFNPSGVLTYLARHTSPSFTHLRFSSLNFDFSINDFPTDLGWSLGVDVPAYGSTNDASAQKSAAGGLASLRHVIVHGNPAAPNGWCGFNDGLWDDMCGHLRVVAQEVGDARDVKMVQMSRPWRRNPRWADRLRDDWVDRMEGGDGCWVSSEEEEIRREVYEDDPPTPRSEPEDNPEEEEYEYAERAAAKWYDREGEDGAGWGNAVDGEDHTGWYDI